ncbi:MAG: hypothetical protein Q9217_002589 [Psora testacea]
MATQNSYCTEKGRLRNYEFADVDAPKLRLDELISPSMAISHLLTSEPTSPIRQNGASTVMRALSPPPEHPRSQSVLDSPPRQIPIDRSRRTVSPTASEADTSLHLLSAAANGDTLPNELNPWSSAVGRATTGGKSGRVIERLMNDNDTLLREKRLAIAKLEEEIKRGETARVALESLQVSNDNLISMHESDTTLLAKRDRRIQQLRDDLEAERRRRERAERETRETRKERDDTIDRLRRESAEEKEQCLRATSQYDMLSKSWNSLEGRYSKQTDNLKKDLQGLRTAIDEDRQKLGQMEIIMEQMAKEAERTKRAKEKLSSDFEAYKSEQEAGIRGIRESAEHNDAANDQAQQQMDTVLGQLKWVVNIRRDCQG